MIKKIDISKFGQFKSYVWNSMVGNDGFKKLNIIYGRNYSGKTTLSRIFRCFEKGEIHGNYCDGEFTIQMEDGRVITQKDISGSDPRLQFRVYNSDFVAENLSWLRNADGTIVPFTILGQSNVEIEGKIKEIDSRLGSIESRQGMVYELGQLQEMWQEKSQTFRKKQNELDNSISEKAKEIKNNAIVYNKSVYHSTHIKTDMSKVSEADILDEQTKERKRSLLREVSKSELPNLPEKKPHFLEYYEKAKKLVEHRIAPSAPLQELVDDALLQEWVRSGIPKHREKRTHCGFCGQALPANLWAKLDAHFDKASEQLRQDIEKLITELETAKQSLRGYLVIHRDRFYQELLPSFEELLTKWEEIAIVYENNIVDLMGELAKRRDDIFNSFIIKEITDVSDRVLELLVGFNQLANENNKRTATLERDQEAVREILRLSEVAQFKKTIHYTAQLNEIEKLANEATVTERQVALKQREIDQLNEEKRTLEAETKDEGRGAELVNRYLEHFFGHQELKLVATGEKSIMKFKIRRDHEDALNLSEGECSLISFCYFIAKMQDELQTNHNNLYIYIDDPISSLDSNHVFFIFSLIENVIAKEKKYMQLFISTHSLDFLKYIKRMTMPKEKDTAYFFMQKRAKNATSLIKAPLYLKDYITEFNYLFSEIHACAIESEQVLADKHHYTFANNMRKFLESYLFFKYPNNNLRPEQRMEKFFDGDGVSTKLIGRIINEYSHLEVQFDRGIVPIDIDEIKKVAQLVLAQIKKKDPDQYVVQMKKERAQWQERFTKHFSLRLT